MTRYFAKYDIPLGPDEVLITTGGSEAIHFTFSVIGDVGDEIVIPEPYYTNYNGYAAFAGLKIVPLPLSVEDGFRLPPVEAIEARITPKTKAILLCSPNNPTGTVYTPEELDRVVGLVKKHDLFLVGDEVYKEFIYDGLKHKSILEYEDIKERVIVVDSISKRYSCCGARIGMIITRNKDVYAAALKFAQARLCPPSVEQMAALAAYNMPMSYFQGVRDEYDRRRNVLYDGPQGHPRRRHPQAAGRFLRHRPPAGQGRRALRRVAPLGVLARRPDGHDRAGPRLLFDAEPGHGRGPHRLRHQRARAARGHPRLQGRPREIPGPPRLRADGPLSEARRILRQALALGGARPSRRARPSISRSSRGSSGGSSGRSFFQASEYPGVRLITLEEGEDLWRTAQAAFLDARRPDLYDEGHVPGARCVPAAETEKALPAAVLDLPRGRDPGRLLRRRGLPIESSPGQAPPRPRLQGHPGHDGGLGGVDASRSARGEAGIGRRRGSGR